MKRLLEVREFDIISGNSAFRDDPAVRYCEFFESLKKFALESASRNSGSDVLEFMKPGFRRDIGEFISVRNYVGVIRLGNGCQVQILPKIDCGSAEEPAGVSAKRVFLRMLKCLKDFPGKRLSEASLSADRLDLWEIFIRMFLDETAKLTRQGLKSAYIEQQENISVYRGKLLANHNIRHNAAHKERFFMAFDEYQLNRPENRLIKSALLRLLRLTASYDTAKEIRKLLTAFELVEPSRNFARDFSGVSLDRHTNAYEAPLKWARVFLQNRSFSPFSGSENAISLLFPMEKIFEAYVAANLKRIGAAYDFKISAQDRGCYLFDRLNGEDCRKFALRPDIVLTRTSGIGHRRLERIIIDTKWKRLTNDRSKNYGISQADMYQMFAYAQKYETPEIWLVYPLSREMRFFGEISFESVGAAGNTSCAVSVFPVDLTRITASLEELLARIEERLSRRRAFAHPDYSG